MAVSWTTKAICRVLNVKGHDSLKSMDNNAKNATEINQKLLFRILQDSKDTEYGKKYDFAGIRSVEDFKAKVPFSDYDTYAPYIERMIRNREKNLITPYPVIHYAETSGTVGVQKKIPVTDRSMKIYTKYTVTRATALAGENCRENGKKPPLGKGLNTLESEKTVTEDGTPRGTVSGAGARQYKAVFPYYLTSPMPILFPESEMNMKYMKVRFALEYKEMAFMFSVFMTTLVDLMDYMKSNWELLVHDIESGTVSPGICEPDVLEAIKPYLKKHPARAAELRAIFEQGFDTPIIPRLWPNMTFICAIGTGGFSSYTTRMKKYSGDIPMDFSIYGSSEGLFAAVRHLNRNEFCLLPDSCFYEFLPLNAPDNAETLSMDQLEIGKKYEIIITNQCGFYRYRIKDCILVVGYDHACPLITFSHRMGQAFNVASEKTTEEHLNEAIRRLSVDLDCVINDYTFYLDDQSEPSRYVMVIEPDRQLPVSKGPEYSGMLDGYLRDINPEYGVYRDRGNIGMPLVLLQQMGTHALWRETKIYKGASNNQVKPVRVLDAPLKQRFFLNLIEEGQEKLHTR